MQFGIMAPAIGGLKQNFPAVLLSSIYSPESVDVRNKNGELHRIRKRMKELVDSDNVAINAPLYVDDIASYESTTSFKITGDVTAHFTGLSTIRINASTSSDALYTLVSAVVDGASTLVTISGGTITVADADKGNCFTGVNEVMRYHTFVSGVDGTETLFLFTSTHIFKWGQSGRTLTDMSLSGGLTECTTWDTEPFFNYVIATNNQDGVLYWDSDSAATAFREITGSSGISTGGSDYITKAKYVTEFENCLILGHVNETGTGAGLHARRFWKGDVAGYNDFSTGEAGSFDVSGADAISGLGKQDNFLIVLKEKSTHSYWGMTIDPYLAYAPVSLTIGCKAHESVVNDAKGTMHFFATDFTIRSMKDGNISEPINPTVLEISPEYMPFIKSAFIEELGELCWAIPYGADATGNNKVIKFKDGRWNQSSMQVSAFGKYSRQSTISNWSDLTYDSWTDWPATSWITPQAVADWPVDLVSDSSGYTYDFHGSDNDAGSAFTGELTITTTLGQDLGQFKRVHEIQFIVRPEGESDTFDVYIGEDGQSEETAGEVSLDGSGDFLIKSLPVDFRARSLDTKMTFANPFRLLGMIFDYDLDGDR